MGKKGIKEKIVEVATCPTYGPASTSGFWASQKIIEPASVIG